MPAQRTPYASYGIRQRSGGTEGQGSQAEAGQAAFTRQERRRDAEEEAEQYSKWWGRQLGRGLWMKKGLMCDEKGSWCSRMAMVPFWMQEWKWRTVWCNLREVHPPRIRRADQFSEVVKANILIVACYSRWAQSEANCNCILNFGAFFDPKSTISTRKLSKGPLIEPLSFKPLSFFRQFSSKILNDSSTIEHLKFLRSASFHWKHIWSDFGQNAHFWLCRPTADPARVNQMWQPRFLNISVRSRALILEKPQLGEFPLPYERLWHTVLL